ncbi:MAG TPA: TetR/AcrR family transcriptional regulator [Limnobacter sp.]|uniref:TetR/AcrR family transcriptional regulator n=1 Tax=Limnobacter sp. TaxID=2003368 RepID=UPI002EDA49F2
MIQEKTREKRPYLGKEERRKSLLKTAADLVESQGWAVLTMSALADKAGVSRQLVYQHFPNLESLLAATAMNIYMSTAEGTGKAIAQHAGDIKMAIRTAALVSLDLPRGRGDALWQLVSGTTLGSPELESIRIGIRETILQLWAPMLKQLRDGDEKQGRTLAWMLVMAFWGVRQMIRDGLITRDEGLIEMDRVLDRILPKSQQAVTA